MQPSVLYKCVAVDPPWNETGGGKIRRGADRHYSLMKTKDIIPLLKSEIAPLLSPDCHLWLWVTNNYLRDGLAVIEALGFEYKTMLVWCKDRFGIGQYLRGQHEPALFAVRGKAMMPPVRNVPSVIHAKRTEHSAKPQAAYDAFERVSPGPRLDVFARDRRPGWDAWGNQVRDAAPEPQALFCIDSVPVIEYAEDLAS